MKKSPVGLSRLITALSTCLLLSASVVAAQRQEKELRKVEIPGEPFQLVSLKVKGRAVALKRKFVGDADWLKDFEVVVKNVSEKQIVYLTVEVFFPATETLPYPLVVPLRFGKMPESPEEIASLKGLAPGKSAKLVFDGQLFENVMGDLSSKTGGKYTYDSVELRVGMTVFSDDTMWSEGQTMRRDPSKPGRWRAADSPDDILSFVSPVTEVFGKQARFQEASLLKTTQATGCVMKETTDHYQCGYDRCDLYPTNPCYVYYDSYIISSIQTRNNWKLDTEYSSCTGSVCNWCGSSQPVNKTRYDPSCTWTSEERPQRG